MYHSLQLEIVKLFMNKFLVFALLGCCSANLHAQDFGGWAMTPPMGWNSWDCFGPTVTEQEVMANADYMAEHLKQFGWQYIVVDIRWYVENDKAHGYNEKDPVMSIDEYGRLIPAVNRFPSSAGGKGFKPLGRLCSWSGVEIRHSYHAWHARG